MKQFRATFLTLLVLIFNIAFFPFSAAADEQSDNEVSDIIITKHPYSESLFVGDSIYFIAHADNADSVTWFLVRQDSGVMINLAQDDTGIPMLVVSGANSDTLQLSNIPLDLDGWAVRARFSNTAHEIWTDAATLTVQKVILSVPIITTQPINCSLPAGGTCTLSCSAGSTEGGIISYQWYCSLTSSVTSAELIPGATGPTYDVCGIQEVTYYFASVCTTDGINSSASIYSNIVSVTPDISQAKASGSDLDSSYELSSVDSSILNESTEGYLAITSVAPYSASNIYFPWILTGVAILVTLSICGIVILTLKRQTIRLEAKNIVQENK